MLAYYRLVKKKKDPLHYILKCPEGIYRDLQKLKLKKPKQTNQPLNKKPQSNTEPRGTDACQAGQKLKEVLVD